MRGFLFGLWKLGEGVVLLRFLWGFRAFFLKRFIGRSGCVVVSEGVGCVRDSATVSKGAGLDDADGNPVLLVRQRHGGGQVAWRVLVVGTQTEIWSGRWGGYRIEIFFELDAVISGGLSEKYLIDTY